MITNEQAQVVYQANKAKGFWPENPLDWNPAEAVALMCGELYESLEAHRKNRRAKSFARGEYANEKYGSSNAAKRGRFKAHIKDTMEDELADTIIRLLDFCGGVGIPLIDIASKTPPDNYGHAILKINFKLISAYHLYAEYLEGEELTKPQLEQVTVAFSAALQRIEDLAAQQDIDLDWHINEKLLYNTGRPFLHGKDY